jgi:ABC-type sugar transport system substrate-binding protein
MKKGLAVILALLMIFSLFACGSSTAPSPSASTEQSAAPTTEAPGAEKPSAVEIGYYDPSYDYSKNDFTVVYMMSNTGVLYDMFDKAFQEWAKKANVNYSSFAANGDNDLFLTTIETYAAQGVDGFLFDADNTIYPRVAEITNDLGIAWMSCMAEPLDENGKRTHPVVGFDNVDFGHQMAQYDIDYLRKTWPEAKPEEVGMLSMDFSLSPQVHQRTTGAQEIWLKEGFLDKNFVVVDGATSGSFSAEGGFNLAAPAFASRPDIKYWLVTAFLDDYADGAARAAEQAGIDGTTVVTTCGGSGLINHWDKGEESCWKSAIYCAQILFGENIFFALYAFMSGQATPETIFPEWKTADSLYPYVNLPTFVIEKDTYKEYMEWVDKYTGINMSPYDADYKGTEFPSKNTPPSA